ncbi:hypothetical protein HanIR_Chr08g0363221 [Helianthus annuus]|nr:hypothetical protein HanIR_Chr08g0363221 [Helianthus annuus]
MKTGDVISSKQIHTAVFYYSDSYSCVLTASRFIQLCFNSKQIHTVVF